jgi:F420-0:gamma-glutamyl ligase
LCRGHQLFGGKKMTVIVTTDDLRPWRNGVRRFALLNERKFIPLGDWNGVVKSDNSVVKSLLAISLAAIIHGTEA